MKKPDMQQMLVLLGQAWRSVSALAASTPGHLTVNKQCLCGPLSPISWNQKPFGKIIHSKGPSICSIRSKIHFAPRIRQALPILCRIALRTKMLIFCSFCNIAVDKGLVQIVDIIRCCKKNKRKLYAYRIDANRPSSYYCWFWLVR